MTRREELLKRDPSQQRCTEKMIPALPHTVLDFIASLAPGACLLDTVGIEIYCKLLYV
jgi:hypothetical protein